MISKSQLKTLAYIGIAIFVLIVIRLSFFTKIRAGYEGVKVEQYGVQKGVSDVSSVEGLVFYNPITQDVFEFPVKIQSYNYEPFVVNSADGSEFTVQPSLSLRVIKGRSPEIFKSYRKSPEKIIKEDLVNYVKVAYQTEINNLKDDDVIGKRKLFNNSIKKRLVAVLEKEGFELKEIQSGLSYPGTLLKSIQAKNAANQLATKTENEVRQIEAEANKARAKAKGEADAARERAQGKADALRIEADAQEYANSKLHKSLTPLLIDYYKNEKWNGVYPTHMLGNSSSYLIK